MLSSFAAFFSRVSSDEKEQKKEPRVSNFVYRDHLNKNPSTNKPKKAKKVSFATSVKPQLAAGEKGLNKNILEAGLRSHTSVEEKGVIRVKLTLTKTEAARLLSKCKDGGLLEFKDVASDLVQIPMNRVDVMCPSNSCGSVLKSIPEEFN